MMYPSGGTEPTHRGCHKFIPRHKDEIFIEIGDPIYVELEADDLWCEGGHCLSVWTACRSGLLVARSVVDPHTKASGELHPIGPNYFVFTYVFTKKAPTSEVGALQ